MGRFYRHGPARPVEGLSMAQIIVSLEQNRFMVTNHKGLMRISQQLISYWSIIQNIEGLGKPQESSEFLSEKENSIVIFQKFLFSLSLFNSESSSSRFDHFGSLAFKVLPTLALPVSISTRYPIRIMVYLKFLKKNCPKMHARN